MGSGDQPRTAAGMARREGRSPVVTARMFGNQARFRTVRQ